MDLAELRKKPHLSASGVNDYITCGLLFKFRRIDKLPPEYKAATLEFGSSIGISLGSFYLQKKMGIRIKLEDIQDLFQKAWEKRAKKSRNIRYAKGASFKGLLALGKELLSIWHENLTDDHFKVIAIEKPFSFFHPAIGIPLIGATDLIEEDDSGTIIITDFKTSAKAYSENEINKSLQLTIYSMAERNNGYAGREILLRFDCLIKTKTPKFETYYTTRTLEDEQRTIRKIAKVWDGIQKGVFIPNDTSWKCKNCSYKRACNQWFKGGGD